ncbi:unnamed protein product [Cylicocyclus nassatus]|uniref:Uncharacterized protein n=1 Tax=Cylicocyclus nassatus TaxID=53992 RepID=A0AA36GGJ2_CYLNA|nr:unnamed protein product [Cylicocyclus nassatus]
MLPRNQTGSKILAELGAISTDKPTMKEAISTIEDENESDEGKDETPNCKFSACGDPMHNLTACEGIATPALIQVTRPKATARKIVGKRHLQQQDLSCTDMEETKLDLYCVRTENLNVDLLQYQHPISTSTSPQDRALHCTTSSMGHIFTFSGGSSSSNSKRL